MSTTSLKLGDMSLTFPIADTALAALKATRFARTRREATEAIGGEATLVSEWLRPSNEEHAALRSLIEAGVSHGYVQVYEGPDGGPVFAVTLWRKGAIDAPRFTPGRVKAPPPNVDETDDLYFIRGRTRRRARGERHSDPRQLDLFAQPVTAVPDAPALDPKQPPKRRKKP